MQLGKGGNYCFRFYYYSSFWEFLRFYLQLQLLLQFLLPLLPS